MHTLALHHPCRAIERGITLRGPSLHPVAPMGRHEFPKTIDGPGVKEVEDVGPPGRERSVGDCFHTYFAGSSPLFIPLRISIPSVDPETLSWATSRLKRVFWEKVIPGLRRTEQQSRRSHE